MGAPSVQAAMEQLQSNPAMMQQMMQMGVGAQAGQLTQNPELLAQMMQSPMVQQMMEQMMSNPQMVEEMFRNHPMFAGNPQAAEMGRMAAQMFQQNEFRQVMQNPEAVRAMMQIQQGMSQLQQSAPGLLNAGFPTAQTSTTQHSATPSTSGTTTTAGTGGAHPQLSAGDLQQALSQVLQGQQGQQQQSAGSQPPPPTSADRVPQPSAAQVAAVARQQFQQAEVLYQSQLEQLHAMGFTNRQANLRGRYRRVRGQMEL